MEHRPYNILPATRYLTIPCQGAVNFSDEGYPKPEAGALILLVSRRSAAAALLAAPENQALVSSLAESYGKQLRRFLLARVRNPADVPDVAQEVYLRMLRVPRADSIRSPEAYLFTVAQHVVQQHGLREATIPHAEEITEMLDPPVAESDQDPALAVAALQFAEKLQDTLDHLTPKARAAFILHRRDGMSPEEIAAHLGVSRPMVKKYLLKALLRLRVHLDSVD